MARKTIEQRLDDLDAQRATLKVRLGKRVGAKDTRRNELFGALVLWPFVPLLGLLFVLFVIGVGGLSCLAARPICSRWRPPGPTRASAPSSPTSSPPTAL